MTEQNVMAEEVLLDIKVDTANLDKSLLTVERGHSCPRRLAGWKTRPPSINPMFTSAPSALR